MGRAHTFRIFISAVTGELGTARKAVAEELRRRGLEVRDQEHFRQGEGTLLEKLEDYILQCDAVLFLVGTRAGAFPTEEHARPFTAYNDWERYTAASGQATASYTQWEYILARHHQRSRYVFFAGEGVTPDKPDPEPDEARAVQSAFVRWLKGNGEDRDPFTSLDDLKIKVLRQTWPDFTRPKPIHLPYRSLGPLFKGRDAFLRELRASLERSAGAHKASAVVNAVHGLGGVGKTRVAVEYALAHEADYTALLFVPADDPDKLMTGLAALAETLDLPEKEAREEKVRIVAVLAWLQQNPGWLLILDNVDTEDAARAAEALLAKLRGGHVLITSRISRWSGQVEALQLGVLAPEDAARFLLDRTAGKRRPAADDAAQATALAGDLGHLSLMLEQAAAYIVERRLTLSGYRAAWQAKRATLLAWSDPRTMQYPTSVAVTWATTVDQFSAPARALLEQLAWLAPDPVPESLLEAADEAEAAHAALAELARWSLIERDGTAPEFTAHRLVQEVARQRQDEAERHRAQAAALAMVFGAYPKKREASQYVDPHLRTPLVPHVAALAAHLTGELRNRNLGWLLLEIGDHHVERGALGPALEAYKASHAIRQRLAAADPGTLGPHGSAMTLGWQRDLSVSHNKIGDVLAAQGNLPGALEAYKASHAIRQRLAAADPGNAGWQRDLSVSHLHVGDVLVAQGNLPGALEAYNASHAIFERLAAADPGNARWQRDLSVSHDRIGDVLRAQGNLPGALEAYNASHAIFKRLAAADPGNAGWQRDLSVSHNKIGNVLVAQGNLPGALEAYNAGLAIAKRLATADPGNAESQRDLSISHNNIGDVLVAQGNLPGALEVYNASRAIAERLAAADPGNAEWQRDLSVSHERIGDVLRAQGNLPGALEAHNAGLAIAQRLAAADPGNAEWQADLAASHGMLGQLHVRLGNRPEALRLFKAGRAIVLPFAERSGHRLWIGYVRSFDADIAALEGK